MPSRRLGRGVQRRRRSALLPAIVIPIVNLLVPATVAGQNVGEGLLTGLGSAVLIAPGIISARAIIFGRPTYGIGEGVTAVGIPAAWTSLSMATFVGAADDDRLGELREGAALGLLGGGAAGLLVGLALDRDRWLGWTTIGIAAGLIGGAVIGLIDELEDSPEGRSSVSLEVLRLRL